VIRAAGLTVLAVFFGACAMASATLDTASLAGLSGAEADGLLNQCSRQAPQKVQGKWTPNSAQLGDLRTRLPGALDRALSKRQRNKDRAAEIAGQYAGFVIGGRKIIYVNAFPKRELDPPIPGMKAHDWRHEAVIVCDGGAVFFGVEYDPKNKTFANFAFNGAP
jgi:hypothetical protein